MIKNKDKPFPLVITCAVVPQIEIALSDPKERLKQYRASIVNWVESGAFSEIVIVDCTNNDILTAKEIEKLSSNGINIEQLKFGPEVQVQKRGASWGVGKIYEFVVQNSKLVNECDFFAATTGRTFVGNISSLLKDFDPKTNKTYVNRWLSKGYKRFTPGRADLRFIIWNKSFFETNIPPLLNALDDSKGNWIEIVYDEIFANSSQVTSFKNLPQVIGQTGHGGGFYDGTNFYRWFVKNLIGRITKAGSYSKL